MNPQQQSYNFDVTPILRMYMESIEAWKKNYESLAVNGRAAITNVSSQPAAKPAYEAALGSWQKSGEDMFKHFIDQQIEICRFFGARWEQYLKLPGQLAQCHTPADIAQVQATFLNQFAHDYMQETGKLSQPMGELMSRWAGSHNG
jgi:hypothetical protein